MPGPKGGRRTGEPRSLRSVPAEGKGAARNNPAPKPAEPDRWPGVEEPIALPVGRHNLPRELSSFVGRQHERAQVVEMLGSSPLVTITGPSGIGKTRLALHVAAQLVPDLEGGVWLVELVHSPPTDDPDVVAEAVAAVLDPRPGPGQGAKDSMRARPRDTAMLVVLDNCEHLTAAAAQVAGDLLNAWPNLSVLATSQQPLGVNSEQVLPLPPLSLPEPGGTGAGAQSEAVALFHARATAAQHRFVVAEEDEAAVAEICRRLDGIPLAVELAAARTAVLSPTEIAEHLQERFDLLSGTAAGATHRHRSLQSALDWSYDLLWGPEKALLRRLSIFAGGAGLAQVRDVCAGTDVDAPAIIDLLTALVSKSLVVADTSGPRARYRLLETVRAYARERLDEAGEAEQVANAHADWFTTLAERGWDEVVSDPKVTGQALEQEHDNLLAALGWLIGSGRAGTALRLAAALTPFWKMHGHLREGREWLERGLAATSTTPDDPLVPPALRAQALWGAGLLATLHGDHERATSALEEARALARAHGDQRAAVTMNMLLGFISATTGDPATGLALLEESVQAARDGGDGDTLTSVLGLYGRARLFTGDTLGAREVFEESRRIGRSLPDGGDGDGLLGLGWVTLIQGRHDEAQKLLEQAMAVMREGEEQFEAALVLSFLGELAWLRGDNTEARSLFQEGLDLARYMGASHPEARCALGLAGVAWAGGDPASASALADEAVAIARKAGHVHTLALCLRVRADLHRAQGEVDAARALFEESMSVATASGDKAGVANTQCSLALLSRLEGDYPGATSMYLDALEQFVERGDQGSVATVLEALAGLSAVQRRAPHAGRLLGAASAVREVAACSRSPLDQCQYDEDLALVRAALGDDQFMEAWTQGTALSVADAIGLVARGGGERRQRTRRWEGLTPAEEQVSELVAEGLSNPEIAQRMCVSRRTVEGHIARLFDKVGVNSRRQFRDLIRQQE